MEVLGYLLSIVIGVFMGFGAGSSLMVPLLSYCFGLEGTTSIFTSLLLVGVSSFLAGLVYIKRKQFDTKILIYFGVPSVLSVILSKKFLFPAIPEEIVLFGTVSLTKHTTMMIVFASLMILSALPMIRPFRARSSGRRATSIPYFSIAVGGIFVGMITGIFGSGSGFLIIPFFALILHLSMNKAVGTSRLIVATNTMFGFFSGWGEHLVETRVLLTVLVCSLIGIALGMQLAQKVDDKKLKPMFGMVILATGVYMLIREII